MRVIAGTARSMKLKTLDGLDTRPTTDRIKETLFNMLQFEIPGSVFVDLFSGSGGIGIEALSRGASKCYFVENNKNAISCIQENLVFTRMDKKAIVMKQDVLASLQGIPEKEVNILFMDPPYNQEWEKKVLSKLTALSYITSDTMIVVEASLPTDFSYAGELGFIVTKEKCYKTNKHVFLQKKSE